MATRRRARRKFTWFPVLGSAGPVETDDEFSGRAFQVSVDPVGGTTGIIIPLIPDVPMEGDSVQPDAPGQLVQAIGQEYLIERIVGNCFLHFATQVDDPPTVIFPRSALVGVGIFVARAEDANSGGPNVPIGSLTATEIIENYGVLGIDTIREPWMFRRTWVLGSGRPKVSASDRIPPFAATLTVQAGTGLGIIPGAPTFNGYYGARDNGPFVDVKSVRRVRNDERLFFAVFARTLDVLLQRDTSTLPNQLAVDAITGYFDYRVLGALRRARNSSAF